VATVGTVGLAPVANEENDPKAIGACMVGAVDAVGAVGAMNADDGGGALWRKSLGGDSVASAAVSVAAGEPALSEAKLSTGEGAGADGNRETLAVL
jgi:hypothetical protein